MFFVTSEAEIGINPNTCLYFYAEWMPFHKKMVSMLSKLEAIYENVSFFAIDVTAFKPSIKRFGIDKIPTIIFFSKSLKEKKVEGAVLYSALKTVARDIFKEEVLND